MSEYLLSAEPHTQSFGTSAKFRREWLQNDKLAEIQTSKNPNTNTAKEVLTGPMRPETKHPYFLRSRCNSMPQRITQTNVNNAFTEIHFQ